MSPNVKIIVPKKAVRETDERISWWVSVVDKALSKGQPKELGYFNEHKSMLHVRRGPLSLELLLINLSYQMDL